ncbi:hypothetical protein NC797_07285 [Aquibacillus sp. 3ASR75-11]|uniref:DUF4320 family protein n=1 Tax=Terrihalobacillus insolitus TaxID=2950438 RepID=A0A9X3WU69_9BACI|nr:hypothetical protein [Terrihalobacillus insolitus]MDC3424311.1 hypothetical protein [Terrihalobacillus insolitus]
MSSTLGKWMTIIIAANIMFAPILSYIDSLHREAVEVVLHEGAKKAAIEGRFTTAIINDMKQQLADNYNFDQDTITITATQTLTTRNNYIEASIEVPRGFIFVFDIFNQGPNTFTKKTKVLSEYLN